MWWGGVLFESCRKDSSHNFVQTWCKTYRPEVFHLMSSDLFGMRHIYVSFRPALMILYLKMSWNTLIGLENVPKFFKELYCEAIWTGGFIRPKVTYSKPNFLFSKKCFYTYTLLLINRIPRLEGWKGSKTCTFCVKLLVKVMNSFSLSLSICKLLPSFGRISWMELFLCFVAIIRWKKLELISPSLSHFVSKELFFSSQG